MLVTQNRRVAQVRQARGTGVPSDPQGGPEQPLMSAVPAADLRAVLDSLPTAFRHAVWLRDVEDCSYAEIAQREAVPVDTVMSRISHGRRLLWVRLTDGAVDPSEAVGQRLDRAKTDN